MLLAQAPDAAGLRFAFLLLFVPHLPFNPVELVEQLQRLRRQAALFLPRLESVDEASPGVSHATYMRCACQGATSLIPVSHQNSDGSRQGKSADAPAHDRAGNRTAQSARRCPGRCDRPRCRTRQSLLQRVTDANEVLFAGADHPMAKSATADRDASALEGLRHAIERCAVDIFMNKSKGQRRGRGMPGRDVRASAR